MSTATIDLLGDVRRQYAQLAKQHGRTPDTCTVAFTATVSRFQLGAYRRELHRFCWDTGCDLEIEEVPGLLKCLVRVTIRISGEDALRKILMVQEWLRQMRQTA